MRHAASSVTALLRAYRQTLQHEHGWEVALSCPACSAVEVPVFSGWTPSRSIRLGNQPTVFANLSCPKCAAPMRVAAEAKLTELFANVEIPESNRRLLKAYVVSAAGSLLILAAVVVVPLVAGWPVLRASFAAALAAVVLARPFGMWLTYAVARHRQRCDCGNPAYKFMGLLGRTYCYRCSSCGRLLRLRD